MSGLVIISAVVACGAACTSSGGGGRAGGASADEAAPSSVRVVALEAQACDRPQPRFGQATLLDSHTALTAGHLVEGKLRVLELDGEPASVVAIDEQLDVAVISTGRSTELSIDDAASVSSSSYVDGPVEIVLADGVIEADVVRALTLRVDDATDGAMYDRPSLELDIVVEPGHSGAPVVDDAGRVVGVVMLRRPSASVSYATRFDALGDFLSSAAAAAGYAFAVDAPCT